LERDEFMHILAKSQKESSALDLVQKIEEARIWGFWLVQSFLSHLIVGV